MSPKVPRQLNKLTENLCILEPAGRNTRLLLRWRRAIGGSLPDEGAFGNSARHAFMPFYAKRRPLALVPDLPEAGCISLDGESCGWQDMVTL